ncbi:MAG: 5'/3'-nucleotidase SurE [Myxococcota bacterium]|nr:5'/3'-nucleotidase SurE [Myxococcota bacterium]
MSEHRTPRRSALALALLLVAAPGTAAGPAEPAGPLDPEPLRILLTNDDGVDAPGLDALRAALRAAGHEVVVVAPRRNQSGRGRALSTDVGGFVDVIEQRPGVWAVESTPADAVRAALGAVMADAPPDLVVSGLNFGENLARTGSVASGTVGAALHAAFEGVPAVAASVGLDLAEARARPRFASTRDAFGPAAAFVTRLVARLREGAGAGPLLPEGVMLNVNVPVPYASIEGVEVTRLGRRGRFAFAWRDPRGVVAQGGGGLQIALEPTLVAGPGAAPDWDPLPGSDVGAFLAGRISVTPLDGDMTAGAALREVMAVRLGGLRP